MPAKDWAADQIGFVARAIDAHVAVPIWECAEPLRAEDGEALVPEDGGVSLQPETKSGKSIEEAEDLHLFDSIDRQHPIPIKECYGGSGGSGGSEDNSPGEDQVFSALPQCVDFNEDCRNPTIFLTVTGASGKVLWGKPGCRQADPNDISSRFCWDLPAESGKTIEVCPYTSSQSKTTTVTTFGSFKFAGAVAQIENNPAGGNGDFIVRREWSSFRYFSTPDFGSVNRLVELQLFDANGPGTCSLDVDRITQFGFWTGAPPPPTFSTFSTLELGVLTPGMLPTASDYAIDPLMGSFTFGGITFSWAKGRGWP